MQESHAGSNKAIQSTSQSARQQLNQSFGQTVHQPLRAIPFEK